LYLIYEERAREGEINTDIYRPYEKICLELTITSTGFYYRILLSCRQERKREGERETYISWIRVTKREG